MEKLTFKLEAFEGPLDVLLHLIAKNKLNICDIQISVLLDQYMEYLDSLRAMDLDVASEFLEMASRLVQIKSQMLLPKPEEEEENDPRLELTQLLLQYQACKMAAGRLRERAVGFSCFSRDMQPLEHDPTYRLQHDKKELLKAIRNCRVKVVRRQPPTQDSFKNIVGKKIVTVWSKIVSVLRAVIQSPKVDLRPFFRAQSSKHEMVAAFLAVLELIKSKKITVEDDGGGEYIRINKSVKKKNREWVDKHDR